MDRNKYFGLKNVLCFTYIQNIKSKAIIGITAFLCAAALFSVPVLRLINDDSSDKNTSIKKVYIVDDTGLNISENIDVIKKNQYKKVSLCVTTDNIKDVTKKVIKEKSSVALNMKYDDKKGFELQYTFNAGGSITDNDVSGLIAYVEDNFHKILAGSLDISDKTMSYLDKDINSSFHIQGAGEDKKDSLKGYEYNVVLAIICIATFAFAMCGESISSSVASEKSSRVIEYLTINVKPFALVMGKVLANIGVFLSQVISIAVCLVLSNTVFGDGIKGLTKEYLSDELVKNFSAFNIIAVIIIILEGFLIYGLMSGLAGAAVSKIENLGESMKLYSLLLVAGAYSGIFLTMGGKLVEKSALSKFIFMFPVTAPFSTPAYALIGRIDKITVIIAIALLMAVIVALLNFTANVYEAMIYYNGETMKLKDIILLSKKEGKHNV